MKVLVHKGNYGQKVRNSVDYGVMTPQNNLASIVLIRNSIRIVL